MIGDSIWDLKAAARAHVRSIGVLSGGIGRGELLDAGAFAVFDDPADLLAAPRRRALTPPLPPPIHP